MRDIALHLGVSRQLVSLVLRDAPGPSDESRTRILAAAEQLGYRPNASARLLRQRRTRLIGALFALRNPFEVRFIEQLEARAAECGYGLVLGARSPDRPDDVVLSDLMAQRVEAVIAFNPDSRAPTLRDVLEHVPLAWMGERADTTLADNIRVDEDEGLRLAMAHLTQLGHRHIAYAGGAGGAVGLERAHAFQSAAQHAGLGTEVLMSDFSEEGGAGVARVVTARPVAARPTAIVCCGDLNAIGMLAQFAQSGVRVPDDVSVIGFDDSYVAGLSYHRLTSIRQDVDATVAAALRTVLRRIEDPELPPTEILTPTSLTIRDSTGTAPQR